MRLSELARRCEALGHPDPIIVLEGPGGLPCDVCDLDIGVAVLANGEPVTYVCLLNEDEES